jgi:hypothetical protein
MRPSPQGRQTALNQTLERRMIAAFGASQQFNRGLSGQGLRGRRVTTIYCHDWTI